MHNWQTGDIVANGIPLHYTRTGSTGNQPKPPLVLAHGLTDNGLCWTPVAEALAGDYDVVMIDARGHGLSSAPDAGYTSADHAADYAGAIQALDLYRPALLGHSMGAATSAYLAAHYPGLVSCILLEDPPWRLPGEAQTPEQRAAQAESWRADVIRRRVLSREELLALGGAERPMWSEAEFGPWVQAKQQVSPNVIDYVAIPSTHWTEYVATIPCPGLLITGDVDLGGIVSPAVAMEVTQLNPRIEVAHIAGAGHSVRREQFAAYVAAVRAFLQRVYA